MNILHMKYAVEVAKAGSVNKAAEKLFMAPPNVSRSIKELESDLGITIFERSAKGVTLTHEGEEFIGYAKSLLKQIDHIEGLYKENSVKKQRFQFLFQERHIFQKHLLSFQKIWVKNRLKFFIKKPIHKEQ